MRAWAQMGLVVAAGAAAVFAGGGLKPAATGAVMEAAAQRRAEAPKELLDRVSAWVEGFVAGYQGLAAEETLEQQLLDRRGRIERRRVVRSDYLVLRLPPGRELAEFRDALAVDEKELQTAEARAAKWPRLAAAATREEIAPLVADPAAHRLAAGHFDNLALLATRFSERYRENLRYFFLPEVAETMAEHTLVGYRQFDGPGLLALDGAAIYPEGQAWVDPDDGHIEQITERFAHKNVRYSTSVNFAFDEAHGVWLPSRMAVLVYEKNYLREQNHYAYANWRRLSELSRADTAAPAPRPRD